MSSSEYQAIHNMHISVRINIYHQAIQSPVKSSNETSVQLVIASAHTLAPRYACITHSTKQR